MSVYSKDITEKFIIEQKLKEQNEELKKLNAELDRFVYSASHDLKAPLASVLGLVNISRMEKQEKKREEYFSLMEQSINKLNAFIQEIIDYSKSSRLELTFEEIDLKEAIDSVIDDLRYINGFDSVDLQIDVKCDQPLVTDPKRLHIILSNVINNAFLYSIQHNSAESRRSNIQIFSEIDPEGCRIIVCDNGPGIPKDIKNKIFDMFYRGQSEIKGSGLGLFIVKETLSKLEGTIEVDSKEGTGATFSIMIPNHVTVQA